MNQSTFPFGVCVLPERPQNNARSVSYPHYVHEILAHAGVAYSTVASEELEEQLPNLRLLLTVGETNFSDTTKDCLRQWVRQGGAWLSIGGLCGLADLLGVDYVAPGYRGQWGGGGGMSTLGEGYLTPASPVHRILQHTAIPLHFFNGLALRVADDSNEEPAVLASVLDKHGRETARLGVLERTVERGRCLLIAPDAIGAVVRIQQGVAITRDGAPAPDGNAPVSDGVLKCDDGAVLDWDFDRQEVPGAPGLKGFLQPIADQWRELILRAIFHLASQQQFTLPVLWLYPRNLPALAHMSHDTDNNVAELGQRLLEVVTQAQIHTTWCVIAPGYDREFIAAIRDAGHELAMHYDAMSKECPWSEPLFEEQWRYLQELFGERPVSNKNHYTRWEGDTEFFEWCRKRDIKLDQTKGPSKTGEVGFLFGSCHPYFPVAPDGTVLDVLELPLMTQDLEVFAPFAVNEPMLAAAVRHHGVLHLLFHPGHMGKEPVVQALLESVAAARAQGLEWWTARQINAWERARRQVQWSQIEPSENGCKVLIRAGAPLPDATLLFLCDTSSQFSINDLDQAMTSVTRWGFEFQAVTLHLEQDAEFSIQAKK